MKIRIAAAASAMAIVASCATPPKTYTFDKTRTYPISKDEAWERLLGYFTTNNIQIKTIEKDSGVIYAERALVDASIADCGDGGLTVDVSRSGGLNVFVRAISPNETQVSVNSDYKITRTFDTQVIVTPCNSTGLIEGQILRSIQG
jgi:hypothetical protein